MLQDDDIFADIQRAKEIGRNDPCWCGSGRKFKYCHRDREEAVSPTPQNVIDQIKRSYERKICLHYDASNIACGSVIHAHTIQRSELSKLARSGKVYGIRHDYGAFLASSGKVSVTLMGINRASTINGFCEAHDSSTFTLLETAPFMASSQQCLLLAYRAICRELYAKEGQLMMLPFTRSLDAGKPLEFQVSFQRDMREYQRGVELGLNDLRHFKTQYDEAVRRMDGSQIWFYVVWLKDAPTIACSGALLPEYDFAGRELQRLDRTDIIPDHLTFSLIPVDTCGAAVFSWLGPSSAAERMMRSLDALSNEALSHALVRFCFEQFENIFAAPDWWENLDDNAQSTILKRMQSGVDFATGHTVESLLDDGIRVINWRVDRRQSNIVI